MINITQIDRLVEQRAWERLIERILQNGRGGNLQVRLRLARRDAAAPAALGLAIQRLCELTFGPTPIARGLVAQLLHLQDGNGGFVESGSDGQPESADCCRRVSPAATAIAVRALIQWSDFAQMCGEDVDPRIAVAVSRGLFALACLQDEVGGFDNDVVESAIVLWQLGGRSEFRRVVRFHDLNDLIDAAGSEPGAFSSLNEISRLAHAAAA